MSTFLEAINFVIAQVGAGAVSSESNTLPDVTNAKLRLTEANLWLQKQGWWFNRELNVSLTPDVNDEIIFSPVPLKIITYTSGYLTIRGGKAYDMSTQSDTFPNVDHFHVDLVQDVTWDNLPQEAHDTIRLHAARQMVLIQLEDDNKAKSLGTDLQNAFTDLKKADLEIKKRNIKFGPKFLQTRGGVRPYRSGRVRNPAFPGGQVL